VSRASPYASLQCVPMLLLVIFLLPGPKLEFRPVPRPSSSNHVLACRPLFDRTCLADCFRLRPGQQDLIVTSGRIFEYAPACQGPWPGAVQPRPPAQDAFVLSGPMDGPPDKVRDSQRVDAGLSDERTPMRLRLFDNTKNGLGLRSPTRADGACRSGRWKPWARLGPTDFQAGDVAILLLACHMPNTLILDTGLATAVEQLQDTGCRGPQSCLVSVAVVGWLP